MRTRCVRDPLGVLATSFAVACLACSDSTSAPMPRTIEIVAGDGQQSRPGEELPIPLTVRVIGSDDRSFAGAAVEWRITVGTGSLTPTQSTTNASGVADTRLTLGAEIERVEVTATVQGVAPVTFTSFPVRPCDWSAWREIALGTSISGMLRPLDCELGRNETAAGWLADLYPFRLSTQTAIDVRLRSPSFDPQVQLYSEAPWFIYTTNPGDPNREVRLKAILPQGWYGLVATSLERASTGAYQLDFLAGSPSAESCEEVIVMLGITATQSLAPTDCREPSGHNADRFYVFVFLGQRIRVTQASTQFPPMLRVLRSGRVVAESNGSASGTAVLIYTAEEDDLYEVQASSVGAEQTGPYTLAFALDIAANPQISKAGNDELPDLHRLRHARPDRGNGWARLDP
jgi:hypothetical protein